MTCARRWKTRCGFFPQGKAAQPVRTMVNVQDHGGFLGATPSYAGALGVKIITFYPNNANSRPYTGILMFNPRDGKLRATLEASFLSSVRTAAVSASAVNSAGAPVCFRAGDDRCWRIGPNAFAGLQTS